MLRKARAAYLQVLRKDPTDPRPYVALGTMYQERGELEEAGRILAEGCAVTEGNNPFIWTAMATLEKKVPPLSRVCALDLGS